MDNANQEVIDKATPLSNARIDRNDALYGDSLGVYDRAGLVKKYVKSVFGQSSPEFAQVKGLEFTKPR